MVAFGGDLLFDGIISSPKVGNTSVRGLWVSNGTATGTTEIGGLGDAAIAGVGKYGLQPRDLVALGGEVLFAGTDTSSNSDTPDGGLWVTNGTAKGTAELGGLGSAGVGGGGEAGRGRPRAP